MSTDGKQDCNKDAGLDDIGTHQGSEDGTIIPDNHQKRLDKVR